MAAETSTDALVATGVRTYVPNYAPKPVVFDHGEGSRLWDIDGREYIDLGTGISVNSFGHRHPDLIAAVTAQAGRLLHTSNLYYVEPTVRLAEELVDGTFAERVFFCNSGAEANEAAIKIVRRRAAEAGRGPEDREIITFEGSFHGRTLATVTATAQPKYHEGFEPMPGGFSYCAFNDPEALQAAISDRTCAVMLEPVQGEGGVMPAQQGFLRHVQDLCRRHDALLVLDEIQSGMGRTGKFFAYEWEAGIEPDVVTMAKALAGGLPMGAVLTGARASDALTVGTHGSTFGGNPVSAAAAPGRGEPCAERGPARKRRPPGRCVPPFPEPGERRARPVPGRAGQGAHHRRGARRGARGKGGGAGRRLPGRRRDRARGGAERAPPPPSAQHLRRGRKRRDGADGACVPGLCRELTSRPMGRIRALSRCDSSLGPVGQGRSVVRRSD